MKLYRLTNDPKHITWAVCAMLVNPRHPVPHPRRRRRVRKLRDAGAVRDRETPPRVRTRLPRGGRYRRLPRTPRRTHRRRASYMLAERASPSRRDGVARRVYGRRRRACAGTRRRPGRLGGDARRDGHRRPRTRAGNGGTAPPLPGLVAGPGRTPSTARARTGRLGSGEAATPRLPASLASSPSFPADVSAGGALARELRAAADAAGGARVAGRGPYLLAVEAAWRAFAAKANERAAGEAAGEAAEPPRSRPTHGTGIGVARGRRAPCWHELVRGCS